VFTVTTDLIVSSAPLERAGAASGISETGAELGGGLGIAILGSIGAAVYRGDLASTLPAGDPSEAAAIARDTLGGAVGVAAQLPGDTGPALFDAAREAFIRGMQLTATLSAVAAACIAVLTMVLLRVVPAPAQAETGKQPATPLESEVVTEPEEPIQIIWVGSGCLACPGERLPSQVEG
jgi:MFS transporter, DHA2 family, multidrug resistance protein